MCEECYVWETDTEGMEKYFYCGEYKSNYDCALKDLKYAIAEHNKELPIAKASKTVISECCSDLTKCVSDNPSAYPNFASGNRNCGGYGEALVEENGVCVWGGGGLRIRRRRRRRTKKMRRKEENEGDENETKRKNVRIIKV